MNRVLKLSACKFVIIVLASAYINVQATQGVKFVETEQLKHVYFLGGAGLGILEDASITDDGQIEDGEDLALRFGMGYQINRYLGIEINYFYFSLVESEFLDYSFEASAQSLALLAVAKYPVEKFAFFAKLGPSYDWKKVEITKHNNCFGDIDEEETENELEAAYGGGVEYNFTNAIGTQVEYLVTGEETSALTANLVFRF